jgi:hypothetical protein
MTGWLESLFGSSNSTPSTKANSTPSTKADSFNWGSLIQPAITSAWRIYSGMMDRDAEGAAQNQELAQKQAQFDAELAYKYAALAKAGGGGGGARGPDPRLLAIQRQQANDAAFANRLELMQNSQKQTSDSIRSLVVGYQNAYK